MRVESDQLIEGRYVVQSRVHGNETAELFDALDTQLDRAVTVQKLAEAAAADPDVCERFLRHQQAAACIHDCPILTVYDAGTWEGRPYSVMEQSKGRPAGSLYRQGYPPDVPVALKVTRQTADALRCCREARL